MGVQLRVPNHNSIVKTYTNQIYTKIMINVDMIIEWKQIVKILYLWLCFFQMSSSYEIWFYN